MESDFGKKSQSFIVHDERLIWEIEKPKYNYRSPVFTCCESDWELQLEFASNFFKPILSLEDVGDSEKKREPFIVKTCCINNGIYNNEVSVFFKDFDYDNVGQSINLQMCKKDIRDILPAIRKKNTVTIICGFYRCNGCRLPVKTKELTKPSPDFTRRYALENPKSSILNSPLNLESLSDDLTKLFNGNLMTDVQLVCGDNKFHAHKLILASRSNVFSAMFENKMAESKSGVICIEDIDASVMSVFLKYLYSGKIDDELPEDTIIKLYAVGDKYAVYALMKICSNFMAKNLTQENFSKILTLADLHNDKELQGEVADFVIKHGEILKMDSWISFSEAHLKLANQIYQKYIMSLSM